MTSKQHAIQMNEAGLAYYQAWELDNAIQAFTKAINSDPQNPEYRLNLTRAYTRSGQYDQAMEAMGAYLEIETDTDVASRYERLFSTALDDVEISLINGMKQLGIPVEQIGKAIQMWLEYRITIGRKPLRTPKPDLWAAGIAYAIIKINFLKISRQTVAELFDVNERSLKAKYDELIATLDLMPADYRYFTGNENPLDKLVEAARILEDLDKQFQDEA
jgi:tetratricopeptide (TPR) repeat protein